MQAYVKAAQAQADINAEMEYFWHDSSGAHVLGGTSGYINNIKSNGMYIEEVTGSDWDQSEPVAFFGVDTTDQSNPVTTVILGRTDKNHSVQTPTSWKLVDEVQGVFASIDDIRTSNGLTTLTEHFVSGGSNSTQTFYLWFPIQNGNSVNVKVDGVAISTDYFSVDVNNATVTVSNLYDNFHVDITYTTDSPNIKAYTFGFRSWPGLSAQNQTVGVLSYSEGVSNGKGLLSHSEGNRALSTGDYSHAEGWMTQAKALASHAANIGTIADSFGQTVIGRFNEVKSSSDLYAEYLLLVGNGYDGDTRRNALAVTDGGDIEIYCGSSSDLYNAINALGWLSEVEA